MTQYTEKFNTSYPWPLAFDRDGPLQKSQIHFWSPKEPELDYSESNAGLSGAIIGRKSLCSIISALLSLSLSLSPSLSHTHTLAHARTCIFSWLTERASLWFWFCTKFVFVYFLQINHKTLVLLFSLFLSHSLTCAHSYTHPHTHTHTHNLTLTHTLCLYHCSAHHPFFVVSQNIYSEIQIWRIQVIG